MQATKPVKKPGKQRKLLYNAPAHLRHKLMAAPLSPELIASKGVKTLPVRKGDTVRILRGDHKGFEGKISRVDPKNYRIYVEGLTREKVDGTNIFVPVHPSKVMIRNLNLDDKWRKAILEIKEEASKKEEKAEKAEKVMRKPPAKAAKVKEEKEVKKAIEEKHVEVKEKVVEAKVAIEKKTEETTPKAKPTKVQKKPAAKKKKEEKPTEEEKPATKEEKPKAAKRTRAKRKPPQKKKGERKWARKEKQEG
jgi:large subunit ribosomal protein L24